MFETAKLMINSYILKIANYLSFEPSTVKYLLLAMVILFLLIGWYINRYSYKKYYYPVIYENAIFIASYMIIIILAYLLGVVFMDNINLFTLPQLQNIMILLTSLLFLTLYFRMVKNTSFLFATFTYLYVLIFLLLIIPISIIVIFYNESDNCYIDYWWYDDDGNVEYYEFNCDEDEKDENKDYI